jgi:LmbE family N-acetylglucosaminyl deacetylase
MSRFLATAALVCALAAISTSSAQMRVVPLDQERGHVALGLALRHLANVGIFMETTAHPDDEHNGLLVMLNRGQGYHTALATATRGNGGQNEIGPELFEALGVLRTQELAALHRFDGADQYFTRAVDFGYSFSIDETFEKWGKAEITADYVRLIRTIRPDVVISMMPTGSGGGQHHQASALITREAFKAAGDATNYPEQLNDGLRPWQPKKFYFSAGFGFPGEEPPAGRSTRISFGIYDSLLGKTYSEIGAEARSMHKCQGMGQLLASPGPAESTFVLAETSIPGQIQKDETSLFDGLDTSIEGLAKYAGPRPPRDLTEGLMVISAAVQAARRNFDANDEATLKPLLDGLYGVRVLRRELRSMPVNDAAKFEIEFRLRQKEGEFQRAVLLAGAIHADAFVDDGVVVPEQTTKVSLTLANHGSAPVTVKQVRFAGFDGDATCNMTLVTGGGERGPGGGRGRGRSSVPVPARQAVSTLGKDQVARCEPTLRIPANARMSEPYWHRKDDAGRYTFDADAPFGLPFRPTPFYVQVTLGLPGGEEIIDGLSVEHRYQGDIFSGEKRSELMVVPALSIRVSPGTAIVPAASIRSVPAPSRPAQARRTARGATPPRPGPAAAPAAPPPASPPTSTREIRVTVVNDTTGPAEAVVHLELPQGWTVTPLRQALKLERADESSTVRFQVKPAENTATGEYRLRAVATANGRTFGRGYETIDYPHIQRYQIYDDASTKLKVINVRTPPDLTIGYVMGVGDQVPPAIEQLGAKAEMITADDLAWGNLSRFDAIMTGVRAYERRDDLRANNGRLLDYVYNGGTVIVQYNKFEFNQAQYGPYPAKVSANRVTDENAPVQLLEPKDPLFTTPNEVADDTWKGWVQERGLYFLGEKDSRYHDLIQIEDTFPNNKGPKTGALVEAAYGKGRWVYVGLGLWRQLPAGTDGAYELLANLISLGRTGASRTAPPR